MWSRVSDHLVNFSFTSVFALHRPLREISGSSAKCVHQLDANFAVWHCANSAEWVFRAFFWPAAVENDAMRSERVNHNSKVVIILFKVFHC